MRKSEKVIAAKNMDNESSIQSGEQTREEQSKITPDWTESEWFQVWLKLARRDYQTAGN